MNNLKINMESIEQVCSNTQISDTSAILRFKRNFSFVPGQVIGISIDEQIPPRLYSIASGQAEKYIDILYKILPGGELTPKLFELKPNDTILVSQPFGNFILKNANAWLIASGTGIAPFFSMLKSGLGENIKLIHSSRFLDDFYFAPVLQEMLRENYIKCYTGSQETTAFRGRCTHYLKQHNTLPENIKYYICGSAEMVVDTRDTLINKGVGFQHILSEIYF